MPKLVWSQVLIPPLQDEPILYNTDLLSEFTKKIRVKPLKIDHASVELPETISRRTLSRAGILLACASLDSIEPLKPFLARDPFSVGLYCAMEPGPVDFQAARLMNTSEKSFAEVYRENVSPKIYFHTMPSLPAAHISIHLGIQGRSAAFTDSVAGSGMALQQAKRDLASGRIQAALVCGAFSLESPFTVLRESKRLAAGQILCETAIAAVFISQSGGGIAADTFYDTELNRFGNCQALVELGLNNVKHTHCT